MTAVTDHLYRDTGVVLRTYKLRRVRPDRRAATAENGKVRAVAKGVRKTKSKFGARLEPMSHVRLLLYQGRELDIVSQAEAVEPLSPLLSSLDRASQGLAVLEAVDQLSLEREPNPQLYRMLVGVLRTIAERPSPLDRRRVLLEAARQRGHAARARRVRPLRRAEPDVALVAFDLNEGGVLCRTCRSGAADQRRGARAAARHPRRTAERRALARTRRRRPTRCRRSPPRPSSSTSNAA